MRLLSLLFAICALPAFARAHDLGAMSVTFTPRADRQMTIEVVVDLEHASLRDTDPADIARLVHSGSEVRFDGALAETSLDFVREETSPGGSARVVVGLHCPIPDAARGVTWKSTLPKGQYIVRMSGDSTQAQWLEGARQSRALTLSSAPRAGLGWIVAQYVGLGFTHIVPEGLDHILFVLGLFLLGGGARPLLSQVTAFTLAHSLTLGLAMYGVVHVPPSIVEPAIAISIAYVAIENILTGKCTRRRTAVVFAFGLLHGLGFAGVLRDLGLPRADVLPALVSFNIGVELGQLAVIALAFLAVGVWWRARPWFRVRVAIPASVLIALTGLFWAAQRIMA